MNSTRRERSNIMSLQLGKKYLTKDSGACDYIVISRMIGYPTRGDIYYGTAYKCGAPVYHGEWNTLGTTVDGPSCFDIDKVMPTLLPSNVANMFDNKYDRCRGRSAVDVYATKLREELYTDNGAKRREIMRKHNQRVRSKIKKPMK